MFPPNIEATAQVIFEKSLTCLLVTTTITSTTTSTTTLDKSYDPTSSATQAKIHKLEYL
jgi:hypothetical protein